MVSLTPFKSSLVTALVAVVVVISVTHGQDQSTTTHSTPEVHISGSYDVPENKSESGVNQTDTEVVGSTTIPTELESGTTEVIEYEEEDEGDKFVDTSSNAIVSDHVDFVILRLKHISMKTSSNISELRAVQKLEFARNPVYKEGWLAAKTRFEQVDYQNAIFKNAGPDSIARKVPEEYHIAIIAYTLASPAVYYEFNKATREICSGLDVDSYKWTSYFKLLQLAIETLGSQVDRWRDSRRFLYRGNTRAFHLKEGQVLAFQSFISTSAKLGTAENFSQGSTIFEYEGIFNGTAMSIKDHSAFKSEEEYLFSPLQVFRVDSIHVGSHNTRYVLVKHEIPAPPCEREVLQQSVRSGKSLPITSGSGVVGSYDMLFYAVCLLVIYLKP